MAAIRGAIFLLSIFCFTAGVQAADRTGRDLPPAWAPRPAAPDAPEKAARVRIVDFGADFLRDGDGRPLHQFHVHRYRLERDERTGLASPAEDFQRDLTADVDGDGNRDDDVVGCHPFSLTQPFSPLGPWYDTLAGTPRWFGGAAIYQANARETRFSEDGVNHEHDGPVFLPRDNWALFHETYEIDSPYRLAALWLWKKEDFLNGGAQYRVSFDGQSELALYLQRYFMGIDGCRWLIEDGEQFYISEAVFRGAGDPPGTGEGKQHVICPLQTRWARYNPKPPHDIYFQAAGANFENHEFQDVRAVGFYVAKDSFVPAYFGFKWYAFEADAVVHRRERPSEHAAMIKVPATPDAPEFYVAKCETPYQLWKDVFRLARSNTFVRPPRGFNFAKDGDMGSMDFGLLAHEPGEPVTDITLHDVAAWLNALSEQESRTPCYYEDAAFKIPFHEVIQSPVYVKPRPLPLLHVRWDADGYRLPTPAEWRAAWRGQQVTPETAWIGENGKGQTHRAGIKSPGGGLYDMLGNAWELTWSFGDAYDSAQAPPLLALGGDFRYPEPPVGASASPFGDKPYEGAHNLSFRFVRRETGLKPPALGDAGLSADVPRWKIEKNARTQAAPNLKTQKPELEMAALPGESIEIARREITYAAWKRVRDWAEAHGYTFDRDGDMGSMDYWGFGEWGKPHPHTPSEPVTDLSYYDAAAWCNALSELEGRKPVYYGEENLATVYRKAYVYRPLMMLFFEADAADAAGIIRYQRAEAFQTLYVNSAADGYRLPTDREFALAANGGGESRYSWGDDPKEVGKYAWLYDTSAGSTHPVGVRQPNKLGIFDIEGNVSEMGEPQKNGSFSRLGGSFIDLTLGLRPDNPPFAPMGWGYPDIGFRVVRQTGKSAVVKESGEAPDPPPRRRKGSASLGIDTAKYDGLTGRAWRGNLQREGVHAAAALRSLPALKWKFQTGGPIKSSPVVVDGTAYFGSNDKHIYAVDIATGSQRWRVETGDKVTGSAAVADGVVYIASEDGQLYALDAMAGEIQWKTRIARRARPCGSPAVVYGKVFIGGGAVGGSAQGVMTAEPIIGLDAKTGEKVWEGPSGPQGYAALCASPDSFYCGFNGSTYCGVDLATGNLKWSYDAGHQDRQFVSMALSGGVVYAVGTMAGSVSALDPATGKKRWQAFTNPKQVVMNNEGIYGCEILTSPAIAHGRVYVGCNDGRLHTFAIDGGERGWTFQAGGPIQSSPAVADSVVYFGSHDGHLYALDATEGSLLWKFKAGARIISSPWPDGKGIYFGCDDGLLYALSGK